MENHFAFYKIEERFFIDERALKQTYLALSKENHPDFFIEDEERYNNALEFTSKNNAAYKTLKSFANRVKYILELNGLIQEQGNNLPSPFLMEMMEVNEEIMDLKMDFDAKKAAILKTRVDEMAEGWNSKIKTLAQSADGLQGDQRIDILHQIKEIYLKQKYVLRIKESLNTFAPL